MRRSWLLPMVLCAAAACEHAPTASPERTAATPQLAQVPRTGTHFAGTMLYWTYGVKGAQVLQNSVYDAAVDIDFLAGNDIHVLLTELHGATELVGQMTPSGQLTMEYSMPPGDWLKWFVGQHSGCTVKGTFPVWHGSFDGTRLVAATEFNGQCPVAWPDNEMFATPVDGPVHWKWAIDMTVAP